MIELGVAGGPVEVRASGYTDQVIAGIVAAATEGGTTTAAATAALETAAGEWGRSFAAADVAPANSRTAAITPAFLMMVGRELCRRGQSVHVIEVTGDGLALLPAWEWDVHGGPRAELSYRLSLAGPSETLSVTRPAAALVHCRYAVDPIRPWSGIGPLQVASASGRLAGNVAAALADETGGPRGTLITVPAQTGAADDVDGEPVDPYAQIRADLGKLKGGVALPETFADGSGDRAQRPDRDWKPERLGAQPPAALVELHRDVFGQVLTACGLSPAMFGGEGGATGQREGLRTFYRTTLLPTARLVTAELARKLDVPDLKLTFRELAAADVATAARSYAQLRKAGMGDPEARTLAGLE